VIQRIGLLISNLCDTYPIELRENQIALFVLMNRTQVKRNIQALEELLEEKSEVEKIRAEK